MSRTTSCGPGGTRSWPRWRTACAASPQDSDRLLPLDEVTGALGWRGERQLGLQTIRLDTIVGTVDSRREFDRHFRPTSNRVRYPLGAAGAGAAARRGDPADRGLPRTRHAFRQRRPPPGVHRRRDRPAHHRRLRDRDTHHRTSPRHKPPGGLTHRNPVPEGVRPDLPGRIVDATSWLL